MLVPIEKTITEKNTRMNQFDDALIKLNEAIAELERQSDDGETLPEPLIYFYFVNPLNSRELRKPILKYFPSKPTEELLEIRQQIQPNSDNMPCETKFSDQQSMIGLW